MGHPLQHLVEPGLLFRENVELTLLNANLLDAYGCRTELTDCLPKRKPYGDFTNVPCVHTSFVFIGRLAFSPRSIIVDEILFPLINFTLSEGSVSVDWHGRFWFWFLLHFHQVADSNCENKGSYLSLIGHKVDGWMD